MKLERNTQTVKIRNRYQQVNVDAATQMVGHHKCSLKKSAKDKYIISHRIRLAASLTVVTIGSSQSEENMKGQMTITKEF